MNSVTLRWPDNRMSPNARVDRRAISGIRKEYRQECGWLCKEAGLKFPHLADVGAHVRITFHPPDKRRRDMDNMLSSIKSGLDGVADATGVDDHKWDLTLRRGEVVKDGAVKVEIGVFSGQQFVPFRGVVT